MRHTDGIGHTERVPEDSVADLIAWALIFATGTLVVAVGLFVLISVLDANL